VRVSIIIPVLDEAVSLAATIRQLADIRAADEAVDVIFVDGGSHDDSVALLRAADFDVIQSNRGRAQQMNAGAAVAGGDILMFLHADTRLPDGAMEQVRNAVREGARSGFFAVRLDSDRLLLRLVGRLISARSRVTGIATGDQAIFVCRNTFKALGGFAPLPLFEDVELTRRLKRRGMIRGLPGTVTTSARRWERMGPARTIVRMWGLRAAYACGIRPERLASYYEAVR